MKFLCGAHKDWGAPYLVRKERKLLSRVEQMTPIQ
jgi:hypothetical protein